MPDRDAVRLRHDLRPGDLGAVAALHGELYAREHGFDVQFEAYVAGPLAAFVLAGSPRSRLWLAEAEGRLVGCVAIVEADPETAQLRWYLVHPEARGAGLGRRLLRTAIDFCAQAGYRAITLWTVSRLEAAARQYRGAGFERVEARPERLLWGQRLIEERYELRL